MTLRTRRRVEAVLALLAFPVAIVLTVVSMTAPAAVSQAEGAPSGAPMGARVAVRGGEALGAYSLADRLTGFGYDVVAVQPEEAAVRGATEVVYYERSDRGVAERLRNQLGVGTIRREQVFSRSSDVMILIGKDLHST